MDVIKDISNSGDRNIIVSLPGHREWLEYLSDFMALKADEQNFKIVVDSLPRTTPGMKCYIVHEGYLRGYMEISKMKETPDNEICIELIPILYSSPHKVFIGNIVGYKYYFDNLNMQ